MRRTLYVCETCGHSCMNFSIHGDVESKAEPMDSCPACNSRDFAPEQ